jgi:hypothetical protein
MDEAARDFVFEIETHNPWVAVAQPLPESLDNLDALRRRYIPAARTANLSDF